MWKFRLLQDEIRLINRQLSDPFPALDDHVPESNGDADGSGPASGI